jgi:hypothetical protein
MPDIFDYDVFLSFASTDEAVVKLIWPELCISGLCVFWSDTSLKQRLVHPGLTPSRTPWSKAGIFC